MDIHHARAVADQFIERLHRLEDGDRATADEIAALFADGAELTNPLMESKGGPRRGRDQIAAFWRQYAEAFGKIHSEFLDITASDHSAGLFWRSTGSSPSGEALEYEGVSLLIFDGDGRIARFQGFFDPHRLASRPGGH